MCARRATVVPPPRTRSAISNGSRLLANVDARSAGARRFRDLVRAFSADLGDNLSEGDLALVRQAATLIQRGEQFAGLAVPAPPDIVRKACEPANSRRQIRELLSGV